MNARRRTPDAIRKAELGVIHAAAHELGMENDAYRSMLERITGLNSAKGMDGKQRQAVIEELRRLGARKSLRMADRAAFQRKFKGRPQNVAPDIEALVKKVGALLTESEKPWAYAHAMAKRMFHADRVEWLRSDQIHKLVAALNVSIRRNQAQVRTGGGHE